MNLSPAAALHDASLPRKRPRLIAHRGARREAPENTLAAFQRAIDLGAEGIEFDVQLTSDKVPVITHDDDLSILTHFRGALHRTPFDTVRTLDMGSHFSTAFAGTTMPTLPEALELLSRHDVLANIEIKVQPGFVPSAAELVGGIISDFRMRGPVIVSSFGKRLLHELGRRHPKLPRALVFEWSLSFFPISLFARLEHLAALHPYVRTMRTPVIERMQRAGYAVNAWTVNEPQQIDACVRLGLDGIITDDVAFAKRHLDHLFGRREARA